MFAPLISRRGWRGEVTGAFPNPAFRDDLLAFPHPIVQEQAAKAGIVAGTHVKAAKDECCAFAIGVVIGVRFHPDLGPQFFSHVGADSFAGRPAKGHAEDMGVD